MIGDDDLRVPLNGEGCHACGQVYEGAQTACDNPTCFEEWQLGNMLIGSSNAAMCVPLLGAFHTDGSKGTDPVQREKLNSLNRAK